MAATNSVYISVNSERAPSLRRMTFSFFQVRAFFVLFRRMTFSLRAFSVSYQQQSETKSKKEPDA